MINAIYPPVAFSSASPSTFRFPSLRVLSERLLAVSHEAGIPKRSTYVYENRGYLKIIGLS